MRKMLVIGFLGGCFTPEAPPPAPQLVSTSVDGDAPVSPTATLKVQLSAPIDADSVGAVALVRGLPDSSLVTALSKPPLSAAQLSELVAVTVAAQGDTMSLTPRRALAPSARYTLVVAAALRSGGISLGRSVQRAFTTGTLDEAAPILQLIEPPDGAAGVVRNLRAIEVAWSRPMPLAQLLVVGDDGSVVPSTTVPDGDQLKLQLDAVLAADRRWELRAPASVTAADGQPPFGDPPGFSTGDTLQTTAAALLGLVLESADRCLVARFSTDRPTLAELCVGDRCSDDVAGNDHAIGVPLVDARDGWGLRAWDESTAPDAQSEGFVDMPPLPLVLTEILADPLGPRRSQQCVELYNVGDDAVDLTGLHVATASGFDLLPQAMLPSGGYAVGVPSGFIDDGLDVTPAAGSLVLRVGNERLGGRGIREGGEPLWVEDGAGTLITRWGGFPATVAPGQSLWRRPFDCDLAASFRPGTPTPGGPSP